MASKNLGAVIQRAISDGAFRRQLQSDPAAALRGFNLTADEVAAIRSGDSSKLMSLGVDQRMSKAFTISGGIASGVVRASVSDISAGGTAATIANDPTAGTREGIVGDPTSSSREALTTGNVSGTRAVNDSAPFDGGRPSVADPTMSGTRAIHDSGPTDLRGAVSTGDFSGTRAIHDSGPADLRLAASTGDFSGTRAIHDSEPADLRSAASTGDFSGTRAVNDSEPFAGNAAINDNMAAANAGRGGSRTGDVSGTRAVHDSEPFAGNAAINDNLAAADAGRGGSLTGDTSEGSARAIHDVAPFGTTGSSAIEDPNSPEFSAAHDGGTLASQMADAGTADAVRAINDVAPFEGNVNAAAASGSEFLGGDARLDPGTDSSHGFVPSDSADVQREMLDPGDDHGNALGNTGGGHPS
jgi:hypothetical protein